MKIFSRIIVRLLLFVPLISPALAAHASDTYVKLQHGTEYMVAISPAKYDYPDYKFTTVVLLERKTPSSWARVGHQLLDPKWDTISLTVIGEKILFTNHNNRNVSGITIFDINNFFQTDPQAAFSQSPVATVNILRPSSITSAGRKFCVTHMGKNDSSHGVRIYDLDKALAGHSTPETQIRYDDIGLGKSSPATALLHKNHLIVSNHYLGTISIFDLSSLPPTMKILESGSANRLYYPLGMAISGNKLYVTDHIHYFVNVYDLSDLDNVKLLRSFGGKKSALATPYHTFAYDNALFVANLTKPQSIAAFDLESEGNVAPLYLIEKARKHW